MTSALQHHRLGVIARDVETGRAYVYGRVEDGFVWVRVLRFKSPFWID